MSEAKGGAPTKLNESVKKRVLYAIEKGCTYELAANFGGISYTTFNNWMNLGKVQIDKPEDETDDYFDFYSQVKLSEGKSAVFWLDKIDESAKNGQWQAAAWKLERRYPQWYGKTVQEIQGKDGTAIEFANLTPDERIERANSILEQARTRRAASIKLSD